MSLTKMLFLSCMCAWKLRSKLKYLICDMNRSPSVTSLLSIDIQILQLSCQCQHLLIVSLFERLGNASICHNRISMSEILWRKYFLAAFQHFSFGPFRLFSDNFEDWILSKENQSFDSVRIVGKRNKCWKKIVNFLKKLIWKLFQFWESQFALDCDPDVVLVVCWFQCIIKVRIRDLIEKFQVFEDFNRQNMNFSCNYDFDINFVHFSNITLIIKIIYRI